MKTKILVREFLQAFFDNRKKTLNYVYRLFLSEILQNSEVVLSLA